ncbi:MAG TPA: XRE family transcriptional regulator [Solirubrobacteraceae bacterium]|nr:XRE family transcriptional regulator [Solirubrobacteraceae bacterium]
MVDHLAIQSMLAANLRRLRIARHLSLSELARATGISKATLSSIENGRANPTVDTLAGLAGALRVSIAELLEELPLGEIRIVRGAQSRVSQLDGIPQRGLDELDLDGALRVAEIALAAGHARELAARPVGSRAHLFVLEGKLIAGPVERITELTAGDYASFPTDVPHVFEAERGPARALLLSQSPR